MANMKLLISFFLFGILTAYFFQESVDMTGIVKAYFYEGSVDTTADIPPEDYCVDKDSECTKWASLGECIDNESFMRKTCCKSCAGVVSETTDDTTTPEDEDDCVNKDKECPNWASIGECEANESFMLKTCCKSCLGGFFYDETKGSDFGVEQVMSSNGKFVVSKPEVVKSLKDTTEYLETVKITPGLKELCKNNHELCTVWAVAGECETNPTYMKKSCAPACKSCEYLSIEGRCPIDPNAPKAWEPDDLNKMFEKLTQEPYLSKYSVEILSSPATDGDPWVITMDDVVSVEEAETLIELGAIEGYERSTNVGKVKADGTTEKDVSESRTSTNAWCNNDCYKNENAKAVTQRLSNLTGIDDINSEYLQLLKYETGQFYKTHHDYIGQHLKRQQGVRILTVYLYLNDVEAGGGTNFPELDITVMPKRGRALLWPSVMNDDPTKKDFRTTHQALPVEKGIKYGANAWFHQHDFKTPNGNGCQ